MYGSKYSLSCVGVSAMVMLSLELAWAQHIEVLQVVPSKPADTQIITIGASGHHGYPLIFDHSDLVSSSTGVRLDVYFLLTMLPVVAPWSHSEQIGKLAVGSYSLTVRTFQILAGPTTELGDTSTTAFEVIPDTATLRVESLSPSPGAIVALFNQNVTTNTVNTLTFQLVGSGGDGVFGNANDVPVTATVRLVGGTVATLLFGPAVPPRIFRNGLLPNDTYQVRLRGTELPILPPIASAITDLQGNPLDGEPQVALPSGDGTPGGDFVSTFVVGIKTSVRNWPLY